MQLTEGEEKYLTTIPEDKLVKILPYNSRQKKIADNIRDQVNGKFPELDVILIGSSGLEISGQGDIDISILGNLEDLPKYIPHLVQLFGQPKSEKIETVKWGLIVDGYQVELYLTYRDRAMKRQIAVFNKLSNDPDLLKKYEQLKESFNGKSMKEYQRKKYEFYHQILDG